MKKAFVLVLAVVLVCQAFADNVALNKPAWATREWSAPVLGGLAHYAVDGNYVTCWNAGTWAPPVQRLTVDLEDIYTVNKIDLWDYTFGQYSGLYVNYNLYVSTNNLNWQFISSGTLINTYDPHKIAVFAPQDVRYVRCEVTSSTNYAHINEIEVYDVYETGLKITPQTINRDSNQPCIQAYIRLADYSENEIDANEPFIIYPGGINAVKTVSTGSGICAEFDKEALMAVVPNGDIELKVVGKLKSGQYFQGRDIVKIMH